MIVILKSSERTKCFPSGTQTVRKEEESGGARSSPAQTTPFLTPERQLDSGGSAGFLSLAVGLGPLFLVPPTHRGPRVTCSRINTLPHKDESPSLATSQLCDRGHVTSTLVQFILGDRELSMRVLKEGARVRCLTQWLARRQRHMNARVSKLR